LLSRTPVQCLHRWSKILKPGLIKGPWTIAEDRKLKEWVNNQGPAKWSQCSDFLIGRSVKQCRERWFNTLNPTVKKEDGQHTKTTQFSLILQNMVVNGQKSQTI